MEPGSAAQQETAQQETAREARRGRDRKRAEDKRVTLQDREVHRYYQPWLDAHGSSVNVASHVESIALQDLHSQGYRPRSSHDKALIAFAQLAVLRLGVKRAMVSLIDNNQQYILAEATSSSFMTRSNDPKEYTTPDDVWLGSTILKRSDGICEHAMLDKCTGTNSDGQSWSSTGLIVNDCRLDDRFKERSYVVQEPGVRFYAGVPITSRGGYHIGAYAVSDERPRDGLSMDELRFMTGMSQAVMDHLEWARDRVDRFKGERIVRGMAAFIEGCNSLSSHRPGEKPRNESQSDQRDSPAASPEPTPTGRPSLPRRSTHSNHRRKTPDTKQDKMSRMFDRAAHILRESTLADGAVVFGAAPGVLGKPASMRVVNTTSGTPAGLSPDRGMDHSHASDSGGHSTATGSDSDATPSMRPCKILALSLADEKAQEAIEQKSALSYGTLEKYRKLFPRGKTFYFTDHGELELITYYFCGTCTDGGMAGSGCSSGDDSMSEKEDRLGQRRARLDHKELLKKIPGAKSVTFLPLYDYAEERLVAGCFLWTSMNGRMMNLDEDMSHLHAFGNSIISEAARIDAQKNEAAKTTFIASMSHELRSPLHGILGATEFLKDTAADSYQAGLITSIITCGKTLLDTLNHVLDYSKINKLGRAQMRRNAKHNKLVNLHSDSSLESISMMAEVDLDVLVEEVVEAVAAGHAFKKNDVISSSAGASGVSTRSHTPAKEANEGVFVLLNISPRHSWRVKTQPGALRRIIMNLLGNALKYTSSGFVAVTMRAEDKPNSNKINAMIQVVDSGKGMSEDFQAHRLFVPFSQEDSFQPGTGLGLSIVKQIADSLGASIDVRSEQNVGTEIDVQLSLTPAAPDGTENEDVDATARLTKGLKLALVDPVDPRGHARPPTHPVVRFENTLTSVCEAWFGLNVYKAGAADTGDADIIMYAQAPSAAYLLEHHDGQAASQKAAPIIVACINSEEAIAVAHHQGKVMRDYGRPIDVLPQPCGPRKLAKVFERCLRAKGEVVTPGLADQDPRTETPSRVHAENDDTPRATVAASTEIIAPIPDHPPATVRADSASPIDKSTPESPEPSSISATPYFTSPPPLNPDSPSLDGLPDRTRKPSGGAPQIPIHVLLVDDNKINLQLLVMFMTKHRYSFSTAENGLEALQNYKESCLPGPHTASSPENPAGLPQRKFDYVLMDISMPVMNGMEATKAIREFERENGVSKCTVIALTGLASAQAQKEAEVAGIDIFLPKPVKFGELKKLLVAPKA
jgi:signal transduction histidine kinase/CheY-like chemotaxis protein/GAF domain-containing protein